MEGRFWRVCGRRVLYVDMRKWNFILSNSSAAISGETSLPHFFFEKQGGVVCRVCVFVCFPY